MAADPAQIALFRLLFDSLRIQTPLDFVLRISMNASICYRFKHVLGAYMEIRTQRPRPNDLVIAVTNQRSLPRPVALVVLLLSATLPIYTHDAISSASSVCQAYPECVAYAYRWQTRMSSYSLCPCIALVDANRVPTQEAWDHPMDVTDNVRYLSMSGRLQVLYLINRWLPALPNELQRCSDLRHM